MDSFKFEPNEEHISSINRTIRMKPDTFEHLFMLSVETGVSFNKIVNLCIEYALARYAE